MKSTSFTTYASAIAIAGFAVASCKPQANESPMAATSTAGSGPSISAAPGVAGSDTPGVPADSNALPPDDRTCKADNDCVLTQLIASGDQMCCTSCRERPVSGKWKEQAQDACAKLETTCVPMDCEPPAPAHAECIKGTCEWVRGEGSRGVPTMGMPSD